MSAVITAIGTANPLNQHRQSDIAMFLSNALNLSFPHEKLLKRLYRASGIDTRFCVIDDYTRKRGSFDFFPNHPSEGFPTTAKRMAIYQAQALPLAQAAIDNCLSHVPDFDKQSITHVITVSCTGMYAPGLDIDVVQQLSLKTSTQRLSINFMGCYGAFNALKMANAICTADKHANVLVVCVELCSIHFQNAWTLDAIIANAIFADGAAAALIQASSISKHLQFRSFHCDIVPQSRQEMAWRIADFGFEMVLTSYVPDVIKTGISQFTDALLQKTALSWQDIHYFAIHPGGLKILQACETALAITPADNRWSYEVFRQYGNMSSATILFVLRDLLQACKTEDNEKKIFSCAFGPGLTLESMILQMSI